MSKTNPNLTNKVKAEKINEKKDDLKKIFQKLQDCNSKIPLIKKPSKESKVPRKKVLATKKSTEEKLRS